jgi:hypothetical protein
MAKYRVRQEDRNPQFRCENQKGLTAKHIGVMSSLAHVI